MLFNSFEFLLCFLPVVLIGFYVLARARNLSLVLVWLVGSSLLFHGYWKASYTWLFVVSIGANYLFGLACRPTKGLQETVRRTALRRKLAIVLGVIFNIGLLAYFKYAMFFSEVILHATGVFINVGDIILPLAISFYTFQQIAFLVDSYRGFDERYSLLQYASYLAFFPHLIAGPIVHHKTLVQQLSNPAILFPKMENLLSGVAIVMIGLFKKVVIADGAAAYVDPVFAAAGGSSVGFIEGWTAAILFSFVIYYDFSGYSDIAIGLARMFNVRFPENFASPYKASSIVDFWNRWHITLSTFLRSYLYIPLGGNRKGQSRQYINLMLTMLIGGLWHGAGVTYIVWGGLHGIFLVITHAWKAYCPLHIKRVTRLDAELTGRVLTYLVVVVAWVFFRAPNLDTATTVLSAMGGLSGAGSHALQPAGFLNNPTLSSLVWCVALLSLVNFLPNTQQFMRRFRPVLGNSSDTIEGVASGIAWRFDLPSVVFVVMLGFFAMMQIERVQSFIYFRF